MKIAMIAAMTKLRVIGLNNDMPWHLPDDLKFFKAKTVGKPVIMGRKTFESIGAKPLPNRPNIVISRNPDWAAGCLAKWANKGVFVFASVDLALRALPAIVDTQDSPGLVNSTVNGLGGDTLEDNSLEDNGSEDDNFEVIIMGGGQLYQQMLPLADRLYLTLIDADIAGDTYFPDWAGMAWREVERIHHPKDERHAFGFDFVTLQRA
jgi:dihydrofolate reductase